MNIFDKKFGSGAESSLPLNPVELYQTCPYKDGYGYLRGIQEEVLKLWHARRDERDIICKMNTGSGKTLTGLLMLYSKMIEKAGPSLYLCPDNQLLEQTIVLAGSYGIPICTFDESKPSAIPSDFLNSKKILVTNFHKLFNGKSIFIRDNVEIGAILIDDAHKCVDIARDKSVIKFPRNHVIAKQLFNLFSEALKHQLPGSFSRLEAGDPTLTMKVPYWVWIDNQHRILDIINDYVQKIEEVDEDLSEENSSLLFNWKLAYNNLLTYDCYISGDNMEIAPIHTPYHEIPSFNEAKNRFILSATFEDDYDFIKDLGISFDSISNPIIPSDRKDVGKRLILAPERFDSNLTQEEIAKFISNYSRQGYNVVVLVPSKQRAQFWTQYGAIQVDKSNINPAISKLNDSSGNFMVFINRYDGVDLHNDLCRVLVIDGLPMYNSSQEHYTEVRLDSARASKKSQIIEQGLGRATRSGGDYCVVFLMGIDLISFMGIEQNLNHFTPVTRAQVDLGLNLLDDESKENSLKTIEETAKYCLTQDDSWHRAHTRTLLETSPEQIDEKKIQKLEFAEVERKALAKFVRRKYNEASDLVLDEIIHKMNISSKEKAWYYQFAAQMLYPSDKIESNNLQIKACDITTRMFHPQFTNFYKALKSKGIQAGEVIKILKGYSRSQDVIIHINNILSNLLYDPNISASSFEQSFADLGTFLGFAVQLPERDLGNGPDILWCMTDNHYLILEAKSRSTHEEITRENIGQLLLSEQWFKKQYPGMTYNSITLQAPRKKNKAVNISENTLVLDQSCLDELRNNLLHFAQALQDKPTNSHTEREIGELLIAHNFTPPLFREKYLNSIKQN